MKPIIEIQDISKSFMIDHEAQRYLSLRDSFTNILAGKSRRSKEQFWALRDVTFDVSEGDTLGIIGKNGAGKSTLLKILSKITPPSSGKIIARGRIASLLEVGTGFHPELSGRENIFMNGAILGMRKAEIRKNFEAIVDFAGVERFLDTPLKHYSSGMQLRLAFAVAAFLENEILVIDEILAVGDAEFQKKCIGKMEDISKNHGRTVLFVSHNMAAVKSLCKRAIVLEKGILRLDESTEHAVAYYLKGNSEVLNQKNFGDEYNREQFAIDQLSLRNKGRSASEPLIENQELEFETWITFKDDNYSNYHITYHLYNELGEAMFSFSPKNIELTKGKNKLVCTFPEGFFNSGAYYLTLFIIKDKTQAVFIERDILSFHVVDGDRPMGNWMGREPGYIKPTFSWRRENT